MAFILFLLGVCVPVAECFSKSAFAAMERRMNCVGSLSPVTRHPNFVAITYKKSQCQFPSSIKASKGSRNSRNNYATLSNVDSKVDLANEDNEIIDWFKYWYPIMPLDYLDDDDDMETKAISITILDTPLVLWRSTTVSRRSINSRHGHNNDNNQDDYSSHEYTVMADICPHRRAPLSTGKILSNKKGNDIKGETTTTKTLACRYHGWQFNKEGSCTRIPMMDLKNKDDNDDSSTKSRAFCAQSYPTQQRDGLLWVYMDPSDTNLPALPSPISTQLENESVNNQREKKYSYILNLFPVSFQSMIENSFDPAHALFTHEPLDTSNQTINYYRSENAIPMQLYELVQDVNGVEEFSKQGFTVQHSPYMISDDNNPQPPLTTRQFIAPYTNIAQLPFYNITLHFVPSRPGETLVFGGGLVNDAGPQFLSSSKVLSKIVPQRFVKILQEFMHFYFANLADSAFRFYNQDVQIMQGQDQRKLQSVSHSSTWRDMYPTTSDRGVKFFQRWMDRFGGRPSYTMPSPGDIASSSNNYYGSPRIPSAWDRHAKYCPQCKRTIRRLSHVSKYATRLSATSLVAAIASLGILRSLSFSTHRLFLPMVLLTMSIILKRLAIQCQHMVEQIFVSPKQVPHYQLMEIYSSQKS
jgi:phenylpropionate dioxygenase-like ring-hydroxylating dioxygenase large terminal subunit